MTRTLLTPQKAASHAHVSRSAIMRAISSKSLKAIRDNRNRWQIELHDLEEWAADRPVSAASNRTVSATMSDHDRDQIKAIATLEAENSHLRERLDEIKEDRDDLRQQVERLNDAWRQQAERLASERPASETRTVGWIERIFGSR